MFRSRLPLLIAQKEYKEQRRISQREIAQEVGLARATVSSWMSPDGMPRLDAKTAAALCEYLECSLADLVELDLGHEMAVALLS